MHPQLRVAGGVRQRDANHGEPFVLYREHEHPLLAEGHPWRLRWGCVEGQQGDAARNELLLRQLGRRGRVRS